MTMAIGLDLSLTRTGVACATGQTRSIATTIPLHATANDRAARLDDIMRRLEPLLVHGPPAVALIEGYSPGGIQGFTMARLGELGGLVRRRLYQLAVPFFEVPPKQLKMYATGRGGATKDDMVVAAQTFGYRPANDDEADAACLRQMALDYDALRTEDFERTAAPSELAALRFDRLLNIDPGWSW